MGVGIGFEGWGTSSGGGRQSAGVEAHRIRVGVDLQGVEAHRIGVGVGFEGWGHIV